MLRGGRMNIDTYFLIMCSSVFVIMVWLIFMVAKDANYRSGYKDGYNAGISSHFHEGFSKIINNK